MIQLGINNKDYPIPSKWNELSKADLLEICRIQLLDLDESYKRLMILKHFIGLAYTEIETLDPLALPEILELFNYLFKESHLTINHIGNIAEMLSPEPGLTTFTFEQYFNQSEAYYYLVLKGSETKSNSDFSELSDLDMLINTLYNYNGPKENHKAIVSIPEAEKLAIFYFYQGCTAFIKYKFHAVFKSAESKAPDGLEFVRLVNSMNDGDISRNEKIKSTNLYEALTYLQTILEKSK
jgi:hypothetical protein